MILLDLIRVNLEKAAACIWYPIEEEPTKNAKKNYVRDNVLSKTLQLELHEKNVGKYPVKQQQQKRKIKATAAISIKTSKTKRKNTTYFKIF